MAAFLSEPFLWRPPWLWRNTLAMDDDALVEPSILSPGSLRLWAGGLVGLCWVAGCAPPADEDAAALVCGVCFVLHACVSIAAPCCLLSEWHVWDKTGSKAR